MRRYDHPAQCVCPYPPDWRDLGAVRFLTDLVLLRLKDAVQMRDGEDADYIVGEDYTISLVVDGMEWGITVPAGLITDLTSVPALLRWYVGRVGPWLEAAIVHDYLYIAWQDVEGRKPLDRDRAFADLVMLRAMEAAKVGLVRRWLIYGAVRAFGGFGFVRRSRDRYVDLPDRLDTFTVPRD